MAILLPTFRLMNAGSVKESERFVLVVRQIVAAMIVMLA